MNVFLLNVMLALIWAAATGEFTIENLGIGFVLGYVALFFTHRIVGPSAYFGKVGQVIRFVFFFIKELTLSSLRVAYDVVTPHKRGYMRPGIVAIPLDAKTNLEITLLANLLTATPGTLSLDISDDRRVLYIHAMYVEDVDALRKEIKTGFERRVLEVLR